MLIFPDIRPFVEGREAAIAANWNDRAQFEDIRKRQLSNLFDAVTFNDRVQEQTEQTEARSLANLFSEASNPYRLGALENQLVASDLNLDQMWTAQPGLLANAEGRSQALQGYAGDYWDAMGQSAAQTQQNNQRQRELYSLELGTLQQLLAGGQISQEQYNATLMRKYYPGAMGVGFPGGFVQQPDDSSPFGDGGIESALTAPWGAQYAR